MLLLVVFCYEHCYCWLLCTYCFLSMCCVAAIVDCCLLLLLLVVVYSLCCVVLVVVYCWLVFRISCYCWLLFIVGCCRYCWLVDVLLFVILVVCLLFLWLLLIGVSY